MHLKPQVLFNVKTVPYFYFLIAILNVVTIEVVVFSNLLFGVAVVIITDIVGADFVVDLIIIPLNVLQVVLGIHIILNKLISSPKITKLLYLRFSQKELS